MTGLLLAVILVLGVCLYAALREVRRLREELHLAGLRHYAAVTGREFPPDHQVIMEQTAKDFANFEANPAKRLQVVKISADRPLKFEVVEPPYNFPIPPPNLRPIRLEDFDGPLPEKTDHDQ